MKQFINLKKKNQTGNLQTRINCTQVMDYNNNNNATTGASN